MKIAAVVTMAVIATLTGQAGETAPAARRTVTVCREGNADFGVKSAQAMASEMFAAIGVRVDWREGLSGCPPQSIQISLIDRTSPELKPGAFAYATPYEDHIRLFYDRVAAHKPTLLLPHLLAHVMVHEITHVLQRSTHHSVQGVMKARWTTDDINSMLWGPLPFTSEDIKLVYLGLAARPVHEQPVSPAPAF
jgi:hypothetical protein